MLNDNVVPFNPKTRHKPVQLTAEQLHYLEDMCTDLQLTFDNLQAEFQQSEFAHGMIVILLDSEGQVYTDAICSDKLQHKITQLSTWMEAFNDIHYESNSAEEVSD